MGKQALTDVYSGIVMQFHSQANMSKMFALLASIARISAGFFFDTCKQQILTIAMNTAQEFCYLL